MDASSMHTFFKPRYMLSTVDYSFWKQFPGPIAYDIIVLESLIPVTHMTPELSVSL